MNLESGEEKVVNEKLNLFGSESPKEITQMSEKDKYYWDVEKVKYIASIYNMSFQRLLCSGNSNIGKYILFDSKGQIKDIRNSIPNSAKNLSVDEKRIIVVDMALLNLTNEEAKVVYNDFFFPQPKKWWMEEFSRSVYYRLRRDSVGKFVKICTVWDSI